MKRGVIQTEGWSFNDRKNNVEKHLGNGKHPDTCKNLLIIGDTLFGPANLDRDTLVLAETLKRELTKVFCEALKPNVEHKLMNNLHE